MSIFCHLINYEIIPCAVCLLALNEPTALWSTVCCHSVLGKQVTCVSCLHMLWRRSLCLPEFQFLMTCLSWLTLLLSQQTLDQSTVGICWTCLWMCTVSCIALCRAFFNSRLLKHLQIETPCLWEWTCFQGHPGLVDLHRGASDLLNSLWNWSTLLVTAPPLPSWAWFYPGDYNICQDTPLDGQQERLWILIPRTSVM